MKILAAGEPWIASNGYENAGVVKAYIYDDKMLKWQQLGEDLTGLAKNEYFGWSIDLSDEGNRLAISPPLSGETEWGNEFGKVPIFELNEKEWTQRGKDLIGHFGDHLGESVSLSAHGDLLSIGAMYNDDRGPDSGRAMVYRWSEIESEYKLVGNYISGEAAGDHFGVSVSLSSNGILAVGGHANNEGYAKIFKYENTTLDFVSGFHDDILGLLSIDLLIWELLFLILSFSNENTENITQNERKYELRTEQGPK